MAFSLQKRNIRHHLALLDIQANGQAEGGNTLGINCYRDGGCGPYESLSCGECPASKPEYANRYKQSSVIKEEKTMADKNTVYNSLMKIALLAMSNGMENAIPIPKSLLEDILDVLEQDQDIQELLNN